MFKKLILITLLFLSVQGAASAAELQNGDPLPPITLQDQFDKTVSVATDVQTLLFAIEKAPSDLVNNYLLKQDNDYLTTNKAYFMADISGMPGMITKMFALPKMRKRPYSILLAYAVEDTAFMPRQKNKVTVLKIMGGKVSSIEFVDTEAALIAAF